jgi:predicted enzyme related to lactoylglutathione lyase
MRLQRAMIFVKDLPRMRDFYSQMLGVRPVNMTNTESWADFEAGGARFALHAIPAEIARAIQISEPPKPRETSAVKLSFQVDDIENERARLTEIGATFIQRSWGAWEGIDPEGNVFGLCGPESA